MTFDRWAFEHFVNTLKLGLVCKTITNELFSLVSLSVSENLCKQVF